MKGFANEIPYSLLTMTHHLDCYKVILHEPKRCNHATVAVYLAQSCWQGYWTLRGFAVAAVAVDGVAVVTNKYV